VYLIVQRRRVRFPNRMRKAHNCYVAVPQIIFEGCSEEWRVWLFGARMEDGGWRMVRRRICVGDWHFLRLSPPSAAWHRLPSLGKKEGCGERGIVKDKLLTQECRLKRTEKAGGPHWPALARISPHFLRGGDSLKAGHRTHSVSGAFAFPHLSSPFVGAAAAGKYFYGCAIRLLKSVYYKNRKECAVPEAGAPRSAALCRGAATKRLYSQLVGGGGIT
jgi:hypothetical protein